MFRAQRTGPGGGELLDRRPRVTRPTRWLFIKAALCVSLFFTCLGIASVLPATIDHKDKVITSIKLMEESYAKVEDYTAIFTVHNQNKEEGHKRDTILIKFKKPLRLYMKWIEGPKAGRQLLYVPGKYGKVVLIREVGVLGLFTLQLNPEGRTFRDRAKRGIENAGLAGMVNLISDNLRRGMENGEVRLRDYGWVRGEDGVRARKIEGVFINVEKNGYEAHRTVVYLDEQTHLPVKVETFSSSSTLIASYSLRNIRLNIGLSDYDFDRRNKIYGFR